MLPTGVCQQCQKWFNLTIDGLAGQEEQRQHLLNEPRKTNSAIGILRLWARRINATINTCFD